MPAVTVWYESETISGCSNDVCHWELFPFANLTIHRLFQSITSQRLDRCAQSADKLNDL